MKHEINWTTGTGAKAEVVVELVTSREIWADGDKVTVPCCEIKITATVNGSYMGSIRKPVTGHPVAVECIGRLGYNAEIKSQIDAAITVCKSTPEWVDNEAKIAKNLKDAAEYDAHRKAMEAQNRWTY